MECSFYVVHYNGQHTSEKIKLSSTPISNKVIDITIGENTARVKVKDLLASIEACIKE